MVTDMAHHGIGGGGRRRGRGGRGGPGDPAGARALTARTFGAIVCVLALTAAMASAGAGLAQSFRIAATVNDEPISAWDVDQRVKFYQATVRGASAEEQRKRALKELVEEALMMQEARRVGVDIAQETILKTIDERLQPLKRTHAQFSQYLRSQGVDIVTLENQIRAQLAWGGVIARTYRSQVSIDESDIEEAAGGIAAGGEDAQEVFVLQRIVLAVADPSDDAAYVRRMEEAEDIRDRFIDCNRNQLALKRAAGITIEDMPEVSADSLQEPTRSLVLQAKSGQMTPPNLTATGVELYAVCDRRSDGGVRRSAERQLLNQELGMLASRHLRDLRQDAVVEFR